MTQSGNRHHSLIPLARGLANSIPNCSKLKMIYVRSTNSGSIEFGPDTHATSSHRCTGPERIQSPVTANRIEHACGDRYEKEVVHCRPDKVRFKLPVPSLPNLQAQAPSGGANCAK